MSSLTYIRKGSVDERLYQKNIAAAASSESTLVVLPTGLGKTVIALLVIDNLLASGSGKILFMAPTRPLVEQHFSFLKEKLVLPEGDIVMVTGETSPERRNEFWQRARIYVATPQVVQNDMMAGICDISRFSLLIFDECHRARGDYSYVPISKKYSDKNPGGLVLGMTASPGSDLSAVEEICNALAIKHIEVRTEDDPDVEPYVQDTVLKWVDVELSPELAAIASALRMMLAERIEKLKNLQVLPRESQGSVRDLLQVSRELSLRLSSGVRNRALFDSMRIQSEAMKIAHAVDMAETQSVYALRRFWQKLISDAGSSSSRAASFIVNDRNFQAVTTLIDTARSEHPKVSRLREIIQQQLRNMPQSRIMVFTQFRDTAEMVQKNLQEVPGVRPVKLIGQGRRGEDRGLKQAEQKEVVNEFSSGRANVLISTSVGEEGLDITSTDAVIFYEPVPSEIRLIQRRGRTGRLRAGKVFVLVTRGTKDEGFYYSSKRKERMMKFSLLGLNQKLREGSAIIPPTRRQKSLYEF